MRLARTTTVVRLAIAFAIGCLPRAGFAEEWPSRPITLVVTFAAGGPADGAARFLAVELSEKLGQRVIVENKAGAGGNLGAASVVSAPPDGYTLLFASSGPAANNKLVYRSIPYDPQRDLTPVVLLANIPTVMLASPSLAAQDVRAMIEDARARPGKLNFGSAGYGTTGHVVAVELAKQMNIAVQQVAYRGVAPMITDILGSQIEVGFGGYVPQMATMRALAIMAKRRMAVRPDVPTILETGVSDAVAGTWYGLFAPAATPEPIVARLNRLINDYIATPRAEALATPLGMQFIGGSPQDARTIIADELKRLEPIIRDNNIRLD